MMCVWINSWSGHLNSGLKTVYMIGLRVELKYPSHNKKLMDRWNQNNDTEVPKYKYTGLCCEKMEREGENEEEMERKWREIHSLHFLIFS